MKKRTILFSAAAAVLLFLMAGCAGPGPDVSEETPPEGALSYEQILENLDGLQAPASKGVEASGRTVYSIMGSKSVSVGDLAAFIKAVKNDFAAYVRASAGGETYLVYSVKMSLPGSASGLMWVPFTWGSKKSFPLISYQHGTEVYRACAPSRFDANPLSVLSSPDQGGAMQNYVECMVGALMASAGYVVVMPDYPGFGDSAVSHPYVQQAVGDSVRDIVVAARAALSGKTVRANDEVYLTGYSEGGFATMAGAKALFYAGIAVNAAVPGDGPYDLTGTMLEQMTSASPIKVPYYLLYTVSGYHAAYPDQVVFSDLLKPFWAGRLAEYTPYDGTHTGEEANALAQPDPVPVNMLTSLAVDTLLKPDGTVYELLELNNGWSDIGGTEWVPSYPLIMVHCPADDVVPYANATAARAAFTAKGMPAALISIVDVLPVPFVEDLLGSKHAAAYPTAMLASFTAIRTVDK